MFDDDLENTSPDDSGAKEGEGGMRGPEGAKGPLVTRRNFIAACLAGAAAMLLWPRAAKADGYDVGGGWFGSAGNWAILKHGDGNWIGSKSGWFSWVCGYSEWIGVAAALWVEAQYSNELYDAFHMQPLAACRDWNDQSGKRLWYSYDADTRLQYWSDEGMTEDHGWALTNEYLGSGYGGWWATPLRDYGYHGKDFFFRRQPGTSSHGFGLSAGFYNVCVGKYAGGSWDDWDNCYVWIHTNGGYSCADWNYQGAAFENEGGACPGDIKAGQDRCRLENRWDLFGGAWKVANACANGNGQCLDVCGGGTSSGTYLWSWEYFGATSQVWYANAAGVDSLGRGHLHCFYPAHKPVLGLGEPAGMNGPSTSATTGYNARVYTQWSGATWNGYSERQFWIGGSTDASYAHSYVTCDATGRNLDLSGGAAENRTDVQFHSNGYDDQWDNRAHQWDFDEVRFAGSIEMPEEYKVGGGPVRCSDPAATCRPYDAFGTGQTPCIYRFMTTDSPKSVEEDGARIVGAYMRNGWGQVGLDGKLGIDRGIPAYRYIGLPHEMQSDEQRVTDFALWIESTAFSGSLECVAHLAGGGTLAGSFPVMPAGHQGGAAPSRALTRGGEEPKIGAGTCASETFRQSLSGGSVSAVALDGSDGVWPAGSRALRLTSNGSAEQVGIAQDKCATVPGSEYTQTAWVRASRDGVSFDMVPIWRSSADDANEMTFEATTEWQRFTASATAAEDSYSAGYVYINGAGKSSNADGDWIEVRCIEVSTPADARSITRGGIEPSMGSGSWHSGTFRESDAAGSVSAVTLDSGNGMWPAGSRALRLTSNGSAGQMGIAQDGCATVPGCAYTQTAWVRAGRDGVSFDLLPIWRSSADGGNENANGGDRVAALHRDGDGGRGLLQRRLRLHQRLRQVIQRRRRLDRGPRHRGDRGPGRRRAVPRIFRGMAQRTLERYRHRRRGVLAGRRDSGALRPGLPRVQPRGPLVRPQLLRRGGQPPRRGRHGDVYGKLPGPHGPEARRREGRARMVGRPGIHADDGRLRQIPPLPVPPFRGPAHRGVVRGGGRGLRRPRLDARPLPGNRRERGADARAGQS